MRRILVFVCPLGQHYCSIHDLCLFLQVRSRLSPCKGERALDRIVLGVGLGTELNARTALAGALCWGVTLGLTEMRTGCKTGALSVADRLRGNEIFPTGRRICRFDACMCEIGPD
jgi:hypothetical protein